jgi:lipopolysaccharide/colanic/teichoic acid biosynthesis glycosyltransferase
MRSEPILGFRITPSKALCADDVTLRGTYWFDLSTRTPTGARLKRALDLIGGTLALLLSAPILVVMLATRRVVTERRIGFRGCEFDAYRCDGRLAALPQLVNVLQGTMSLVGPCPLAPDEIIDPHARRFSMRPGMTGLWRVSDGDKHDADRSYVNRWSLRLDCAILARTLWSR